MVCLVARLSRGKFRGTFFYKVLSNFKTHFLFLFFLTTFWRCFLQQFNKYKMLGFYLKCGLNLLQTKFFYTQPAVPMVFFFDHDHLKSLVYMVCSIIENGSSPVVCLYHPICFQQEQLAVFSISPVFLVAPIQSSLAHCPRSNNL